MQPVLVLLVYGLSLGAALALLYFFHARWYWHALSLAAALTLGLTPIPVERGVPDLLIGSVFLFLFVWGLGLMIFPSQRTHHRPHHA